jgi:broad specificity phosphatase PhoE
MRRLYLVRHASPAIQPNVPSEQWTLSERGIEEARAIADIAKSWGLEAVYSSAEPKAQATALIIGDAIGQPVRVVEGAQELRFDRWIANADAFSEMIRDIFEQPAVSVHGAERASAAAARFAAAVALVAGGPFPAAIVSHGRVLTAYLSQIAGLDEPFDVWRSIPMPGWACLDVEPAVPKLIEAFHGLRAEP